MRIIDTQTHWFSPTLLDAYTQASDYPRCRREAGGVYMFELAPGQWFPLDRTYTDIEAQLERLTALGIDTIVSSSASFGDVNGLPVDYAVDVAHQLNEERAELQREHPGVFYGLATVPWQDGDAALGVVERAGQLGLPGVLIHSNIVGRPVDADELRPVYARLAELGLVLSIHPARTLLEPELRDYGLEYLVGYMFDTSLAALRLVLSGVVADNPDLRIVHPHCGATLPYLAGRIDTSHSKPYSLGAPLPVAPSVQLAGFYTDTVAQSLTTIGFAGDFYETGHMVFGSDDPFMDPAVELDFVRRSCPEPNRVLFDNPAQLFRLDP